MQLQFDILSIGHSSHTREAFAELLARSGVTAIADVRSSPHSRHFPHFSQREFRAWLAQDAIGYAFLGAELGGRPDDAALFSDGVADYEAMARRPAFRKGIDQLLDGASFHRIAMMCSEKDPLDCHRCLLVSRRLAGLGLRIGHIMSDGAISPHEETEDRLLALERVAGDDLFASRAERLDRAYRERGRKVAFAEPAPARIAG